MHFYQTDEEVIAGIRNGESAAVAVLYKEHFRAVSHFVINNNGTGDEAKDIYQEAMIILYEKLTQSSFELSCRISTYLYSICRRLWLRKLAGKSRYTGKVEDFEEFITIEEEPNEFKEENFKAMNDSLDSLGEPCKTLIEDYYVRNMNMQEISEKFGYTNSDNAKNQKYKCLMRLKKLFFSNNKREEERL